MNDQDILHIEPADRIGLIVRNLSVTVFSSQKKKSSLLNWAPKICTTPDETIQSDIESMEATRILDDVSFDLGEGEMLAIMGGSGSGKTTLLNTLSSRINIHNKNLQFDGLIDFTNSTTSDFKSIKSAYLLQTDAFLPGLSVLETLKYQAHLRLPQNSSKEKLTLVDSLIEVLGLTSVRDKIISSFKDTTKSTLSGGEQRRVSLAIQLLTKPSVLFLDEPTTGLDSSNAYQLVKNLKTLTNYGMTIILSIHQPRIETLDLFDKICLLTRGGRLVYYGQLLNAQSYFNSIGFQQPLSKEQLNIIDYLIDLSVKDTRSIEKELSTIQRINELVAHWSSKSSKELAPLTLAHLSRGIKEHFNYNDKLLKRNTSMANRSFLFYEIAVLTERCFIMTYRDKHSLFGLNGGSIALGIALGWMFYKPDPDLAGIRSMTSCLYVMLEVVGFSPLLFELDRLWRIDGKFFLKERSENIISIPGFLISRRIAKFFLEDFPVSLFFSCITYFMWGLRPEASCFFIFLAVAMLVNLIGMSSAMLCFAVSRDFPFSGMIQNIYYQLQNCACGYFANAQYLPVYVRWTKYLAYFWYAFGALVSNQFSNWTGDCEPEEQNCYEFSGDYNLSVLGYPTNWIKEPICILLCWFFGLYIFAGVALKFRNYDLVIAKYKRNTIGGEESDSIQNISIDMDLMLKGNTTPQTSESSYNIDVQLKDINLDIASQGLFSERQSSTILNSVNANFKAGSLNVIMGPSGSGKSTLLNLLTDRLAVGTGYRASGAILLNGVVTEQEDFSMICSYVVQNDNYLLPTLTVRETLYFQAKLRIPEATHYNIPILINDLMRKMGLLDCADLLVGSEQVKGVSGGEKRRLSIAIQLLNKPKILFLDEPTSGLDSFIATSIIELLHELALEGTTVILSIHQPKYEIMEHFENILLLAKGGHVIYNGAMNDLASYFVRLGYPCPQFTNLADHISDTMTNFDSSEDSNVYQIKSRQLISAWRNETSNSHSVDEVISKEKQSFTKNQISLFARKPNSFKTTFSTICRRQMLNIYRSEDAIFARGIQLILLGGALALYFAPLSRVNGSAGIDNRLGVIQEILNLYYIGFMNNIIIYPIERNIFYQEYADKTYGVLTFSLSYLVNELPTEIIPSIAFSVLIVFGIGLPRNAGMFFTMVYSCFVIINCGESMGIITNTIFSHLGLATNILSSLMLIAIFMGGTMSLHMPQFFKAFNWLNPLKYVVGVVSKLGFEDEVFVCDDGSTSCLLNTGKEVLHFYNLDHNFSTFMVALTLCLVIYRVIAVTILFFKMKYYH